MNGFISLIEFLDFTMSDDLIVYSNQHQIPPSPIFNEGKHNDDNNKQEKFSKEKR